LRRENFEVIAVLFDSMQTGLFLDCKTVYAKCLRAIERIDAARQEKLLEVMARESRDRQRWNGRWWCRLAPALKRSIDPIDIYSDVNDDRCGKAIALQRDLAGLIAGTQRRRAMALANLATSGASVLFVTASHWSDLIDPASTD
jgi:hypothetical protein